MQELKVKTLLWLLVLIPLQLSAEMPHPATEAQVEDGGSASKPPRIIKLGKTTDDSDKKGTNKRVKDIELCVPIVNGTIAFYLGKASRSHRSGMFMCVGWRMKFLEQ